VGIAVVEGSLLGISVEILVGSSLGIFEGCNEGQ